MASNESVCNQLIRLWESQYNFNSLVPTPASPLDIDHFFEVQHVTGILFGPGSPLNEGNFFTWQLGYWIDLSSFISGHNNLFQINRQDNLAKARIPWDMYAPVGRDPRIAAYLAKKTTTGQTVQQIVQANVVAMARRASDFNTLTCFVGRQICAHMGWTWVISPPPKDLTKSPVNATTFPPYAYLGHGLDLSQVTPIDITTLTNHILKYTRIIAMPKNGTSQTIGSLTWTVPRLVDVSSDVNAGEASYTYFESGSEAIEAFQSGVVGSVNYLALSADASMNYSIDKTFSDDKQYAMYAFNQFLLTASFDDFAGAINDTDLPARLVNMQYFDPTSPDFPNILSSYKSFFATFGSHVITGTNYGARLTLHSWCSNSDGEINTNYNANMSVTFDGLTTKGHVDGTISGSSEYKSYSLKCGNVVSCRGGDATLASKISANTAQSGSTWATYEEWVATTQESPDIMSFQLANIWDVMSASSNPDVFNKVNDVKAAYHYLTSYPTVHLTKCTLSVSSDWGEFGLLSPSGFITRNTEIPEDPLAAGNTVYAPTRVTFGKEHSYIYQRAVTVSFIVQNDGSAFDIELSHGSNGEQPGTGSCQVSIENGTTPTLLTNSGVKSNTWNTEWFYGVAANATVVDVSDKHAKIRVMPQVKADGSRELPN